MVPTVKGEPSEVNNGESCSSRLLRLRYLAVKNQISGERDDIASADFGKFDSIIDEVENLHQHVKKPREQVPDAEALLGLTKILLTYVKSHCNDGVTPSDFTTCLLRDFGNQNGATTSTSNGGANYIRWNEIGRNVSHVFRRNPGCCTMLGPMDTLLKERKAAVHRKRDRPTASSRPEELNGTVTKESNDTDKNMSTMFEVLRKNRKVRLENLLLNRNSFAQTVENLFALSFLVKDGRAQITLDNNGCHIVSPRNAPAAKAVVSGEVSFGHFVFRFDFKDWKLMKDSVAVGEEMMLHRNQTDVSANTQPDSTPPTTPIMKFSRSRGLVFQDEMVAEDSEKSEDLSARPSVLPLKKRKDWMRNY